LNEYTSQSKGIGEYEEQLILKAKKMSNTELRDALIEARNASEHSTEILIEETDLEIQKLLLSEGVFSDELKRRELLEWALATGSKEEID